MICYELCKECEHLYHCFGRDIAEKIQNEDIDDMHLHHNTCTSYQPERKQ